MKSIRDLHFLTCETAEVYQVRAKEYVGSHDLIEFMRDPLLFHKKRLGLVAERESQAFEFGRAAHVLTLEGRDRFETEYAFGGPVNPKTGQPFGPLTKAYAEWAEKHGKPVVSDADLALIEQMNAAIGAHDAADELLAEGVAEGVLRAEYCGVPCQARLDWLNPERGLVDLKTCYNLDCFEMDALTYRYSHQMAFYRALLAIASGEMFDVHIVAVEKQEPFRVGVWHFGPAVLDRARKENEAAMARLKECEQTSVWPTGFEGAREFPNHL